VVANLDLGRTVHVLWRQAAVADEGAGLAQLHQPHSESAFPVEPLVPCDPSERLGAVHRTRVERHHLGVAKQVCHRIEVGFGHLAEGEALGRPGLRHRSATYAWLPGRGAT
jgi:hypothetical protein